MKPAVWLYALFFLSASISFNYAIEFEDTVLDRYFGSPLGILYFTLFFAFAYYAMAVPVLWLQGNKAALRTPLFWIKSGLFIGILGFAIGFYFHYRLDISTNASERYFLRNILANSKNFVAMLLPLAVVYVWFDRKSGDGLYGLNAKPFDWKPYALLVLCTVPLVWWASSHPSFANNYPTFRPWRINDAFGLNDWQMMTVYELVYGLDFVTIELMFRGALVIGMSGLLGRDALLPMVSAYAFLHFGKPLGETVGSVFGGFILGSVALHTRSIWGGCIVHAGLAVMMDIVALWRYHPGNS